MSITPKSGKKFLLKVWEVVGTVTQPQMYARPPGGVRPLEQCGRFLGWCFVDVNLDLTLNFHTELASQRKSRAYFALISHASHQRGLINA